MHLRHFLLVSHFLRILTGSPNGESNRESSGCPVAPTLYSTISSQCKCDLPEQKPSEGNKIDCREF